MSTRPISSSIRTGARSTDVDRDYSKSHSYFKGISPKLIVDVTSTLDFIFIFFCAWFSKLIYVDLYAGKSIPDANYFVFGLIGSAFCYFTFRFRKHYEFENVSKKAQDIGSILRALIFAFLLILFVNFALKTSDDYSRGWVLIWFVTSLPATIIARKIAILIIHALTAKGVLKKSIAVYGVDSNCDELIEYINTNQNSALVVGKYQDKIEDNAKKDYNDEKIKSGSITDLINDGMDNKFDQIIISISGNSINDLPGIVNRLSVLPVDVMVCPEQTQLDFRNVSVSFIGNYLFLNISRKPMADWGGVAKTIIDYFLAFLLLIVLLPVLLMISIAIKLDSPGPVIFRQQRHGFNHQTINVLKFRTMSINTNSIEQATENDPRFTRVGKFIRKMSLDELPQLINVLIGEMSLVGPRPHAVAHNEYYTEKVETYANRHRVKPGITGLAQVKGLRGATPSIQLMRARAHADIYYIENWSIWLDIKILALTPFVVLFQRNAY